MISVVLVSGCGGFDVRVRGIIGSRKWLICV